MGTDGKAPEPRAGMEDNGLTPTAGIEANGAGPTGVPREPGAKQGNDATGRAPTAGPNEFADDAAVVEAAEMLAFDLSPPPPLSLAAATCWSDDGAPTSDGLGRVSVNLRRWRLRVFADSSSAKMLSVGEAGAESPTRSRITGAGGGEHFRDADAAVSPTSGAAGAEGSAEAQAGTLCRAVLTVGSLGTDRLLHPEGRALRVEPSSEHTSTPALRNSCLNSRLARNSEAWRKNQPGRASL